MRSRGSHHREAGAALAKRRGIAVRCFSLIAQVCVRRGSTRSAPSLRERIRFGGKFGRHRIDGGVDVLAADNGGLAQL